MLILLWTHYVSLWSHPSYWRERGKPDDKGKAGQGKKGKGKVYKELLAPDLSRHTGRVNARTHDAKPFLRWSRAPQPPIIILLRAVHTCSVYCIRVYSFSYSFLIYSHPYRLLAFSLLDLSRASAMAVREPKDVRHVCYASDRVWKPRHCGGSYHYNIKPYKTEPIQGECTANMKRDMLCLGTVCILPFFLFPFPFFLSWQWRADA